MFNALDGVGANVGDGQRFTRMPRTDMAAYGQWATHYPQRITGPNAAACNACHNQPSDDGAGSAAANVHRDPEHSGIAGKMIQRNTPPLFGLGALQRVAEEMTDELKSQAADAERDARRFGRSVERRLRAKGVDFGTIRYEYSYSRRSRTVRLRADTSGVVGVDEDLVVKPFQWKGVNTFVRDFNRGASHNELGMQAVEIVGFGVDGDYDGVVDEMTIGDQTALAVYLAAQPRPTTRVELAELGLTPPLAGDELASIRNGEEAFKTIGCAECHVPELKIDHPILSEPSQNENYRDKTFPAGCVRRPPAFFTERRDRLPRESHPVQSAGRGLSSTSLSLHGSVCCLEGGISALKG